MNKFYIPILDRVVTIDRFPWNAGYNWRGSKSKSLLNSSGARFGGGWRYVIGIRIGGSCICFNLLFGCVTLCKPARCEACGERLMGDRASRFLMSPAYVYHKQCCPDEVWTKHKGWEVAKKARQL